jgi:UDP-glucose 4-epimerase
MERIIHWLQVTKGLRYAALRYFNAAGAAEERGEDHTPETHIIPLLLQVALGQREGFKIFGGDYPTPDGTCVRDYIHVLDLAQAHLLAFRALDEHQALKFNLGNGSGYSIREVIEMVQAVTGKAIPATMIDKRAGDPAALRADSSAIREMLGWKPQFADLQTIVQTAWDWHRSHPHGYAE